MLYPLKFSLVIGFKFFLQLLLALLMVPRDFFTCFIISCLAIRQMPPDFFKCFIISFLAVRQVPRGFFTCFIITFLAVRQVPGGFLIQLQIIIPSKLFWNQVKWIIIMCMYFLMPLSSFFQDVIIIFLLFMRIFLYPFLTFNH